MTQTRKNIPRPARIIPLLTLICHLTTTVFAQCSHPAIQAVIEGLSGDIRTAGYAMAFIMMMYMGIKWTIAEGADERENAKKGIIYVIIGVLLLRTGPDFMYIFIC
jgi:hypothetical protein